MLFYLHQKKILKYTGKYAFSVFDIFSCSTSLVQLFMQGGPFVRPFLRLLGNSRNFFLKKCLLLTLNRASLVSMQRFLQFISQVGP